MTIGRIPSVEGGIQPTIVDAKGDLIVATAADTVSRLAVGTNDYVLTAASGETTGIKWAAVPSPSYTWTSFTPTWSGFTPGNATITAKYVTIGNFQCVSVIVTLGSTSSVTGQIRIDAPSGAILNERAIGGAQFYDASTGDEVGGICLTSTQGGVRYIYIGPYNAASTYLKSVAPSSTVPFTWATGDFFAFTICYEV